MLSSRLGSVCRAGLFASKEASRNGKSAIWRIDNVNKFRSPLVITHCYRSGTPINTVIMFVPQQEAWVVERMGKFHRILEPGLNFLVPIIDRVRYVQSLKEIAIDVPQQASITSDNVNLYLDGVLYLRVVEPYRASYGVEDPEFAVTQLAQTTMRSEIGKISLDNVFRERESLNISIVLAINNASEAWGIQCLRYEIRDIKLPNRVQEAMQMQVEAERKKRAAILESEGIREAEVNVAEGKKISQILASEAEKQERINKAQGDASALIAKAAARARGLDLMGKSLRNSTGINAASLVVAEKYVDAFSKLAKTNNTVLLPANTGDIASAVSQALAIYNQLNKIPAPKGDISDQLLPDDDEGDFLDKFDDSAAEYFSEGEEASRQQHQANVIQDSTSSKIIKDKSKDKIDEEWSKLNKDQ